MRAIALSAALVGILAVSGSANADATVSVGNPGYAQPPPRQVIVVDPPPQPIIENPPDLPPPERYRSPFRLAVGPGFFFSGGDVGAGLGVTADFGTGTVGGRLYAGWFRAQKQGTPGESTSPTGSGFGQYTAEVTLDFNKRGPVHPVFGLGFGALHVFHPNGDMVAGIGTARFGVEYAFLFDDADVRLGAGITGVLPGPAPKALADLKGYGIVGASIAIGF
jgi:hypothetical protein